MGSVVEKPRVLIVDDTPENIHILMGILKDQNTVLVAINGEKALKIAAMDPSPDLILLDIMMPDMDGYEVCTKLKANPRTANIPVLFVTALTSDENEAKGLELGALDYITKPFNPALIKARVKNHLELKKYSDQLEEMVREKTNELMITLEAKVKLQEVFGRYLSDEVVSKLIATPEALKLGGEKKEITIMMSDLRGFTSLSESLPPEAAMSILNNYLIYMIDIIQKYHGTILEFIGDAIMAIFGAPLSTDDHAARAVVCALEMQLAMEEVNQWNLENCFPEIEMGIGINTGPIIVGNIGSEKRTKYGCVGRHVNLTSRIESYTLGGQILISGDTLERCSATLMINEQLEVHPKGLKHSISIYNIGGMGEPYNLYLRKTKIELVPLAEEIPLEIFLVEEKHCSEKHFDGFLTKVSLKEAEIRTPSDIPSFSTLKLRIVNNYGKVLADDIYVKTEQWDKGRSTVPVFFTYLPEEGKVLLVEFMKKER